MADHVFSALADDLIAAHFRRHPVAATLAGVHAHDADLGEHSSEHYAEEARSLAAYRRRLAAIAPENLSRDAGVDWHLLAGMLDDALQAYEWERPHEQRPDVYTGEIFDGVYALVARGFAPAPERAENLLRRLEQVPRVLAQARANLQRPAAVHVRVTLEEVSGGLGLFTEMVPAFAAQVPARTGALTAAAARAAGALTEFGRWLEADLMPRATGDFALGRERFDWKLKHLYKLPYDAETLQQRGYELVAETQAAMARLAAQIEPGSHWRDLVARGKQRHPATGELLEVYRQTVAGARRFVVEHDLVALPPGDDLRVIETPPFLRPALAYAAYWPPGPFDARQDGLFLVTPVDTAAPAAEQAEQLSGHNWPSLKLTVLHEAYPGHHVQISWANQHPSRVRKLSYSSLFGEGWTLWCEQLMDEAGWLATPEEKLFRLKDQLWRACRVVLDAGLHVRGMGVEAAIAYLAETAAIESVSARTEVIGYYCRQPTVPMSYLIGKEELLRLMAEYRAHRGIAFSLRQFHTDLLAHGSIPFHYLRELLLG